MPEIKKIKKRDGRIVKFDLKKIEEAIHKAIVAVEAKDGKRAAFLAKKVLTLAKRRKKPRHIISVEEIQDIVEEVLIKQGDITTAKAYIIYRQQHKDLREVAKLLDETEMVDNYLARSDWRVRENSNMSYSLQGLNVHISYYVIANYWLTKIFSKNIAEAHKNGDFHIHDLGTLGVYCVGWDLEDLLRVGFRGVPWKLETKPAKHFSTALMHCVNFLYTMQGEAAGAVAFSNFDSLLAPFIRYDRLSYKQVKQALQVFIFNMNVPTRVGFQCVSEDTDILTPNGWRGYDEIQEGDTIRTFNLNSGKIENQTVKSVFRKEYKGEMYHLKNRIQDQLISPKHRVVRKAFNSDKFVLEPIEDVLELKSSPILPIAGENKNKEAKISDEQINLMAWIISEGSIARPGKSRKADYRVTIYQSKTKNKDNYDEILRLVKHFKFDYSTYRSCGLGQEVERIRLNAESSRKIHEWFGTKENIHFLPDYLLNLSERQSRLFLEAYLKADGTEDCKISTTEPEILNSLQALIVNCGYGSTVLKRKPTIGNKDVYVLRIIKHKETYIQEIKKVNYSGVIWCPHTKNETIIARRNGKVFITGNTPFSNVTIDLKPPSYLKKMHVLIGGKPQKEKYEDFQKEMDIFNQAFAEVLTDGDANGKPFTFPIPTYNISKDFEWGNKKLDSIWEMTSKYGIPYFANFVNSDMKPDDARSMCPLASNEKVLVRSKRGRVLEYSTISYMYEGNRKTDDHEVYSDGKFIKASINKFRDQKMIRVKLANGHEIKMSEEHLNYVKISRSAKTTTLKGKELKDNMYLPYSLNAYEGSGGNKDLGYFVGAFAGDGSFDGDSTVVFSLNRDKKKFIEEKLQNIAEKHFGAHCVVELHKKTKLLTLKVHSKAAVGLCRDFVEGKERNKCYKARLFTASKEFRQSVVDGHYDTDGGNRHRIYTSSKKMIETLNMLAATLGTTTSISIDNREGRLSDKPNYSVLFYQLNRDHYGDIWFKDKDKLWVRIESIQRIKNSTAFCFEVTNGEPVFTIGTTGVLTHNCRLRLDNRELRKRGGSLFGSNPLTGSIGVFTINLPRIGYLAKNEKDFFSRLEKLMKLAKEGLEAKRKALEHFTEKGLYPYSAFYLRNIKEATKSYWKNHFSTIGILGMNEAVLNFLGKEMHDKEGVAFASKVLEFMRDILADFQQETGNIYNLEATPAEGASYSLALKDKKRYPKIRIHNHLNGKNDAEIYYTNSSQLPVDFTDDIFEALDLQDSLQAKYTGGTVLHGFLGEKMPNTKAVKTLVKNIASNYHLPYFSLTPTYSICPEHGYISGEHQFCPKCKLEKKKTPCEIYSRVVGYLRPVSQWNAGKQQEFKDRKTYDKQLKD